SRGRDAKKVSRQDFVFPLPMTSVHLMYLQTHFHSHFLDMRQQANKTREVTTPIIVRSHVATEEHVKEAIRPFTLSTMDAARSEKVLSDPGTDVLSNQKSLAIASPSEQQKYRKPFSAEDYARVSTSPEAGANESLA
ncbi:hypothetical protein HN51_040269, partial [Arachis hypogaea]